jgi:hydrogenase-4 membrane subunit HyfE
VYEIIAIAGGVLIGLLVQGAATTRARIALLALASIIIGAVVSFISGELLESWAYLVFDAAQVLIAAVVTAVCVAVWRQRSQH